MNKPHGFTGTGDEASNAEILQLVAKWGYDHQRATEWPGNRLPATPRQAALLRKLAERHPQEAWELEQIFNAFDDPDCDGWYSLDACMRGQAHFAISKLLALNE